MMAVFHLQARLNPISEDSAAEQAAPPKSLEPKDFDGAACKTSIESFNKSSMREETNQKIPLSAILISKNFQTMRNGDFVHRVGPGP